MPKPDFYPRSPCGERPWGPRPQPPKARISIHALLAESDSIRHISQTRSKHFYPRSPCGERHNTASLMKCQVKFLSTLSLRRATLLTLTIGFSGRVFLSTLSLRRATMSVVFLLLAVGVFLSTLSLRRATAFTMIITICIALFLSTLSLRRATANWFDLWGWAEYFYPRSPCGERRHWPGFPVVGRSISIHALLAESDGTSSQ